jgi:hypothetical protein
MHFELKNSDIFRDQALDVKNIMLSYQSEPRELIYFHDLELALRTPIGYGADQIAKLRFPFLGMLTIIVRNEKVNRMEGHWFDIDNSIFNFARRIPGLNALQDVSQALERGAITFKGSLEFDRLPPPAGKA